MKKTKKIEYFSDFSRKISTFAFVLVKNNVLKFDAARQFKYLMKQQNVLLHQGTNQCQASR